MRATATVLAAAALAGALACSPGAREVERAGGAHFESLALRLGAGRSPAPALDPTAFAARSGWVEAELPDHWPLARRARSPAAWYRAEIELPAAVPADWALAVDGHWAALTLYWNGRRFASSHWSERSYPAPASSGGALVLPLPRDLVHPGANQLLLHFEPLPEEIAALAWVAVGPQPLLVAQHRRALLVRKIAPSALMLIGGATGALVVALARFSQRPGVGWLGASVMLWCLAHLVAPLAPRPASWLGWLCSAASHAMVPAGAFGLHRMLELQRRRAERTFVAIFALFAALRALAPPLLVPATDNLWWLANLGIGIYVMPLALRAGRAGMLPAAPLVFAGVAVLVAAGLHDLASIAAGRPLLAPLSLFDLLHPLIAVVAAGSLVTELARTMRQARELNLRLEQRVEEKRRELASSYARTAELERERAIAAERERMMRDMHDGTGGQLVSALSMVEGGDFGSEELAETLREALSDLRLAIDSLDPGDPNLLVLLAHARNRLEPRIERHGLRFAWQVEDVPTPRGFGPEHALHVLRIFQEAVTNVVKHARAGTITVATRAERDEAGRAWTVVEVRDDGHGFAAAVASAAGHHGLRNMRRRAAEIGADLAVTSSDAGTRVRLRLPDAEP
jgi:signal transduction histidine kinase